MGVGAYALRRQLQLESAAALSHWIDRPPLAPRRPIRNRFLHRPRARVRGRLVPDELWQGRRITTVDTLSAGWDSLPAGLISVRHGAEWLASQATALLKVPSVIVPEEPIILINLRHPDASAITSRVIRKFTYSHLFR
jgi:hypothetical protein